jgi:hypothetical protein
MTDSNMDSGLSGGTGGTPSQPGSGSAGDQQHSSVDVKALEAALKELQGQVRSLQGNKDRGVNEVKSQVKDLMKQLEWVKKAEARGLSPEEIEEQLELKALLAEKRGSSLPTSSPAQADGNRQQVASPDTTAWLKSVGLTDTDPDVVAAYRDHGDEPGQLAQQLLNITAKRQQVQQRPPNPAQVLSGGGGVTVSGVSRQSLQAEYDAQNKNIPRGEYAIKARGQLKDAIRKKARDAGIESPV